MPSKLFKTSLNLTLAEDQINIDLLPFIRMV